MITKLQTLRHDNSGARVGVEIKDTVKNPKWIADLNYSARELTFDIVNDKDPIVPAMRAIVDSTRDNKGIFWGFVFGVECTSDTTVDVKAYDFERYLKSEGSVAFQSGVLGDRYSSACRRFGVSLHIKEQPTYRTPTEVCDGKTGFDTIKSAADETCSATGEMYCIVVNHMHIELRGASISTRTLLVTDTQNVMTDCTYSEGIDNVANVVQVVQKNTDNSQTKIAIATSDTGDDPATTSFTTASTRGNTIRTWGQIAKVVNARNEVNWAQMVQQTNDELKKRNVSGKKLTLDCIGDTSLTAGARASVRIEDFDKTWTNCPILKATHNFGIDYTHSLEMKVGTKWQKNSSRRC